jgi:hypothetical protein
LHALQWNEYENGDYHDLELDNGLSVVPILSPSILFGVDSLQFIIIIILELYELRISNFSETEEICVFSNNVIFQMMRISVDLKTNDGMGKVSWKTNPYCLPDFNLCYHTYYK